MPTTTNPAGAALILDDPNLDGTGPEVAQYDRATAATFLREYRACGGTPRKVSRGIYEVPGVDYNGGTSYSGRATLVVTPKRVVMLRDLDEGAKFRAYGTPVQGMRAGVVYEVVQVSLERNSLNGTAWQVYLVVEAGTDWPMLQVLNVDMVAVQEVA